MTNSVHSLTLVAGGERPNIFAAPAGAAQADVAVKGAQPSSGFAARDSRTRRRDSSGWARTPLVRGLSLRTSVCIAAVMAEDVPLVVEFRDGGPGCDGQAVASVAASSVGV
jgi:hypothetical protein